MTSALRSPVAVSMLTSPSQMVFNSQDSRKVKFLLATALDLETVLASIMRVWSHGGEFLLSLFLGLE